MNPFLEQNDTWEDFHHNFITRTQEMLSGRVGPNYFVKVEVRLYRHELPDEPPLYVGRSDVGLTISSPRSEGDWAAPAAIAAPVRLRVLAVDVERHSWLKICDRRNRHVVTALELLSPTNKTPGPDRDDYLAKRTMLIDNRVHLVEIDLRRGGVRPGPPEIPPCDCYALVSRVDARPYVEVWPIALRDRLPIIPIPLSAPDADVTLDLQELLNRVYDAAGYGKYIYDETPQPPLSDEDAAWARQFLPLPA